MTMQPLCIQFPSMKIWCGHDVQIWQLWKYARISETTTCRAETSWTWACILDTTTRTVKISSISTPLSHKALPVQQKKFNLDPLGYKNAICANFGTLAKRQVSYQLRQLWKSACISDTAARTAKKSSTLTPWGRKSLYVQLLALWPIGKFHAQIC